MPLTPVPTLVQLGTGATLDLGVAADLLAMLDAMTHAGAVERERLYHLRQLCLGRLIDDAARADLVEHNLVGADGRIEDDTKAVVLAAVRGTGRALTVDATPFADEWEAILVTLARCQQRVRDDLPHERAEQVLRFGPASLVPDPLLPRGWAGRTAAPQRPAGGSSPPG